MKWHWISQPVPFWTDPAWARFTIILINIWIGIPYLMLIATGILMNIPADLYESARIDGATRFQVFLKIIMPLAKPIVIYTVLMAFMAPRGDYVFASYVAFGHQDGYNVAVGLYNWVNTNDFQNYYCCASASTPPSSTSPTTRPRP